MVFVILLSLRQGGIILQNINVLINLLFHIYDLSNLNFEISIIPSTPISIFIRFYFQPN